MTEQTLEAAVQLANGIVQIPDASAGIESIANLVRESQFPQINVLEMGEKDHGLPNLITWLLDAKTGKASSIRQIVEEHRYKPFARSGTARALTLDSFNALVLRHKTEHSVIFASSQSEAPALTAIIDYHSADGDADNCKHRIAYTFPLSDEIKVWRKGHSTPMTQAEFTDFLEEHAAELASATKEERAQFEGLFREKFAEPNDLISLARSLEVHVNSKVKQVSRPTSGERILEFNEEHTNGAGERVEIPGLFMLSVPAFVDGAPVRIPARLRYRVTAGGIVWSYQLYRAGEMIRRRVQEDAQVAALATGLPAFEGAPEVMVATP